MAGRIKELTLSPKTGPGQNKTVRSMTNCNKFFRFFLFSVYIALVMINALYSQQKNNAGPRLELIHADSLYSAGINTQVLDGNVIFRQENTEMRCDSAIRYIDLNKVVFIGDVRIVKEAQSLYAQQIDYYQPRELFIARQDVKLTDSTKVLTCKQLKYWQDENRTLARFNVILRDTLRGMTLTGDSVHYHLDERYARVLINPVFTQTDSSDSTDLSITGKMIDLFDDGERIEVSENVHISRGDVEARCDTLKYNRSESSITLLANPRVIQDFDLMLGQKMQLFLDGTAVHSISIEEDAFVATRNDTAGTFFYDYLLGRDIDIILTDGDIDTVYVQGQATSYYHVIEERKLKGINKVIGDELLIDFDNGSIQLVSIMSTPSVCEGAFYPPGFSGEAAFTMELTELEKRYMKTFEEFER
ncbi:hypothetical protein GF407_19900 [candidate division KSB1 bacterium]|nr:hypothetical protein [candidate division KSB1 bacterium]